MRQRSGYIALASMAFMSGAAFSQTGTDVDWSKAQFIELTMTNYAFTPVALHLQHGTAYRLHLVNNGSSGHSFSAPDLFAAVTVAPMDQAKLKGGEIEVLKGGSADISFVPRNAGSFGFRCTHFLHSTFGMAGKADIE